MRIRPAEIADAATMSEIAMRAYAPYIPLVGGRPHPMDDDYAEKVRSQRCFVAEDGEPVGLLVLVPSDDHLLLENVAVHPARHGQGIGRALLDHAEAFTRELGLPAVRLYTNAAMTQNLEMYERRGYRVDRHETVDGFNRVFLSKELV